MATAWGSIARARSKPEPMKMWPFASCRPTSIPITTPSRISASGILRRWLDYLPRPCCYARRRETEQRLKQEIEALLKQAEQTDAAEDAQYGKGKRGDELPEELARRESRLKKIQQAKAELEQEARERAERERAEAEAKLAARRDEQEQTGKKKRGARAPG